MPALPGMKAGALLGALLTGGCGHMAPHIHEVTDGPEGTREIEFEIKKRIYCDLKRGVMEANRRNTFGLLDRRTGRITTKQFIPNDWGAFVSLSLQVDESSSMNPGVSATRILENAVTSFPSGNVFTPQSLSVGLGGTIASTASRTDKFDAFYTIGFLMTPETSRSVCIPANDPFLSKGQVPATSSPLIVSYLGIEKWLMDAMFTNSLLPSDEPDKATKTPDTITYELKFVVVSSGNVNPTLRLVRLSGNTGGLPLFSLGRTRTHSLIITLGPQKGLTSQTHFASQIGQAVASGNRTLLER
jgi:hypothetical protein